MASAFVNPRLSPLYALMPPGYHQGVLEAFQGRMGAEASANWAAAIFSAAELALCAENPRLSLRRRALTGQHGKLLLPG